MFSVGDLEIFSGIENIFIHAKYLECMIIMSKFKIDEIEIVISVELIALQSIQNTQTKISPLNQNQFW